MKELSIEEKAMAYDKAIEIAKEINNEQKAQPFDIMTRVFPELKESKDEKIRDEIVLYIGAKDDISLDTHNKWLSWLEKQGEQKTAVIDFNAKDRYVSKVDGKIHDMTYNPTDKVEPKFKVGDWIVQENIGVYKVIEVCESWYEVINIEDNHYSISFDKEYMCHLWTIQDAKDGDVLANWNNTVFIFDKIEDEVVKYIIAYNNEWNGIKCPTNQFSHLGLPEPQFEFHPATKEQRDLLFSKMKEAGYEWNDEKKELKKIEFNPDDLIEESYKQQADDLIDMVTEKPAWNKEVMLHIGAILLNASNKFINNANKNGKLEE